MPASPSSADQEKGLPDAGRCPGLFEASLASMAAAVVHVAVAVATDDPALARAALVIAAALVAVGTVGSLRQRPQVAVAVAGVNAAAIVGWLIARLSGERIFGVEPSTTFEVADVLVLALEAAAAGAAVGAALIGRRRGRPVTAPWPAAALIVLLVPALWSASGYDDEPGRSESAPTGTSSSAATTTAAPPTTVAPTTTSVPSAIAVVDPVVRQVDPTTAELYVTLVNAGTTADRLTGAITSYGLADVVGSAVCDDATTAPSGGPIPLPAAGTVVLRAGGCVVRLLGLVAPLEAGAMVDLSLFFESAPPIDLVAPAG